MRKANYKKYKWARNLIIKTMQYKEIERLREIFEQLEMEKDI